MYAIRLSNDSDNSVDIHTCWGDDKETMKTKKKTEKKYHLL